VDNPSAERFCVHCKAILSIDRFAPACTRRICKMHQKLIYRRGAKDRQTPEERAVYLVLWKACHDGKRLFGVKSLFGCKDIAALRIAAVDSLLPIDPTCDIGPDNFVVVPPASKAVMTRVWALNRNKEEYHGALRFLGLISEAPRQAPSAGVRAMGAAPPVAL
jgi:hypothetical protein